MFQTIREQVEVAGVYKKGTFVPKKFQWGEKILLIEEVTLVSELRDGKVKKRMYSCACGQELYRLVFNRETEVWILEEIWIEG